MLQFYLFIYRTRCVLFFRNVLPSACFLAAPQLQSPLTDPNSMPDDEDDSGSDDMGSLV
jgi:hypothetical protein